MNVKKVICVLCCVFLVSSFAGAVLAQDEEVVNPIVFSAEGITFPEELVAGPVTLTFVNDTEDAYFAPIIAGLAEDKTMDDLITELTENPAGLPPEWVTLYGGTGVSPEGSVTITFDLPAGEYALLNFAGEMPTFDPFSVVETDEPAEAPETDVEVSLVDFAFTIPSELAAGPQVWQITNEGEQWHEMAVFHLLDESLTIDDVLELAMSPEVPEGLVEEVFIWHPSDPGTIAWTELDLEPGSYAILCFLPDLATEEMEPHFMHGMSAIVTVTE